MRIIKVMLVLAICVAVLGFYRGWFSLSSNGLDNESDKVNVSLNVDRAKMKDDADKVKERSTELTGKVTD